MKLSFLLLASFLLAVLLAQGQDFVWVQQMSGPDFNQGIGVAADGSGNVYTTKYFQGSADFDPGAGVFNLTSTGLDDIFVSKLDSAGRSPVISEGGIVLATLLPTTTNVSPLSIISVFVS